MKLKGAKTGSSCGGLRSAETNSKLDVYVTALLPHRVIMMMMMIIGIAFPVCVIKCTVALTIYSFQITRTWVNTDVLGRSPEVRVNEVLLQLNMDVQLLYTIPSKSTINVNSQHQQVNRNSTCVPIALFSSQSGASYALQMIYTVSKKTSPTFLAITRESIDGFL